MSFIKMTLLGGFLVILPIFLIYFLLAETLDVVIALATPIINLLPAGTMDTTLFPRLLAILLLILTSFIVGLGMRTSAGKSLISGLESRILEPIPGYSIIRSMTRRFSGREVDERFAPALVTLPTGERSIAFIIEDQKNGDYTVFFPSTPAPGVGTLQIVHKQFIQRLETPAMEVFESFSHWGVGTGSILSELEKTGRPEKK